MDITRPRGSSRRRLRSVVLVAVTALASALLVAVTSVSAVSAGDPCGANGNKISCENSKPGSPRSEWDIEGAGNTDIQGFSTDISANVGSKIDFKVDTSASAYSVKIYRMGYYQGLGARYIGSVTPSATLPQTQPQCITDSTTELYDCGNWGVSASWNVPSTAVSGVYEALLTRGDNGHQSAITFVVRDDSSHSDVVFQTADPTWQAYNTYGGSDFYQGAANGRAYKISYNRPVLTRGVAGGRDFFNANEYPAVEFLERNGYDVSYISGVDSDRRGGLLTNHKTFMSVGHDEYWSKGQRANVEAARDAGVNLMFLSGNEVFWKTRYEASADSSKTDYRTLVSYKETWSNNKIDPSDEWTGTWRDPRFAAKSKGGGVPENGLTGTMFMANSDDITMTVPAAQGKTRLWRNTSVAGLGAGQTATLAPHTVGYESDEDVDNGSRPAGLIDVSKTVGFTNQLLTDFGSHYKQADTTHSMTMYKASSGALVFGAGTIQWSWGLDTNHDSPYAAEPADVRMQQFQVNLLADMSAQPTTLMSGLAAASKSTDTVGPTTTISAPSAGAAKPNGTSVTVNGTASDTGGGIVAGVEVSTDGGGTWHPATGTSSWSYTYVQHGIGSTPIQVRSTDDSANIGAVASRSVAVSCPCSVYGSTVPATPDSGDATATELGLRFTATSDGSVTGVRFYKTAANTGTHVGTLWSASGQSLATVTFSGESASGWQSANFSTPVAVTAGTTYVVSYTAPKGHYSEESMDLYSAGLDATPLTVAGGYGTTPAGVYNGTGRFPNKSYGRDQYYVDVLFSTSATSPLGASNQWPLSGSSSVPASTTVSATYSKALASGTQGLVLKDANGATVAGSTAYDTSSRTITFSPSAPLNGFVKYTATLSGTDTSGNTVTSGQTWSFTTAKPSNAPGVCPCSVFDDNTVPTQLEDPDNVAVTLGMKFSSDVDGSITGVRFYKGVNNSGTHTGTLWGPDGTALATGTFTNESTTGWQDLTFSSPVAITKNTTYTASYRTTVGRYSVTPNAFSSSDLSKPPLHVTSSAGAYSYADAFPASSSSSSYLVDVVFQKGTPSIAVTDQDPANGATSVPRGTTLNTTFSGPISTSGYTETVTQGASNTAVSGTTSLSSDGTVLTFTPAASLPADTDVTVVLSGVTSTDGAALATQTTTFHTAGASSSSEQTLFTTQIPTTPAENDGAAVELGTAFTPGVDGQVTAIRFYKGSRQRGHPRGVAVGPRRDPPRPGHLLRRDLRRLAARQPVQPGRGHLGHDVRRQLPGAEGALLGQREPLHLAADLWRPHGTLRDQWPLPVRRSRRSPDVLVQVVELLRRRGLPSRRVGVDAERLAVRHQHAEDHDRQHRQGERVRHPVGAVGQRLRDRDQVLEAELGRHGYPHRLDLVGHGHATGHRDLRRRDRVRVAERHPGDSARSHRRHDVRRVLLLAQRPLRLHQQLLPGLGQLHLGSAQCTHLGQRPLRVRHGGRFPPEAELATELLRRRGVLLPVLIASRALTTWPPLPGTNPDVSTNACTRSGARSTMDTWGKGTTMSTTDTLGVAVIGAGYWGPNLIRNFRGSADFDLRAVCDLDTERAERVLGARSGVDVTASLDDLLARTDIDAVAIATPARTHQGIALAALRAGKHVLVEKPLADSVANGHTMVEEARAQGVVLMADHTYCYTPVVSKIRELIENGELGDILFIDSVRINLGLIQPDVNVLWDLAPHDLSILDFILPGGLRPTGVAAHGSDPLNTGKACVGYLTLPLPGGGIAHVHVNWLSPTKIRKMVIGGTRRTLVWDDLNPQQLLSVYDRGVDLAQQSIDSVDRTDSTISYRLGDTWSPALPEREALGSMVAEFATSIRDGRASRTDGAAGLRVLSVLEAASASLAANGAMHDAGIDAPVLEPAL